jgi:hypothetical protein
MQGTLEGLKVEKYSQGPLAHKFKSLGPNTNFLHANKIDSYGWNLSPIWSQFY